MINEILEDNQERMIKFEKVFDPIEPAYKEDDFPVLKYFIHPAEGFTGLGEYYYAAYRAVKPVRQAKVNISGLMVALF